MYIGFLQQLLWQKSLHSVCWHVDCPAIPAHLGWLLRRERALCLLLAFKVMPYPDYWLIFLSPYVSLLVFCYILVLTETRWSSKKAFLNSSYSLHIKWIYIYICIYIYIYTYIYTHTHTNMWYIIDTKISWGGHWIENIVLRFFGDETGGRDPPLPGTLGQDCYW
jgi:hypothetical protein